MKKFFNDGIIPNIVNLSEERGGMIAEYKGVNEELPYINISADICYIGKWISYTRTEYMDTDTEED